VKITDVTVDLLTFPHPPGHLWEKGALSAHGWDLVVVHVHTDAGIIGHGEAYHMKNPRTVGAAVLSTLRPLVVGADPFDVSGLWEKMFHRIVQIGSAGLAAIAGIDTACYDIMGKHLGVPVYKLLGRGDSPKPRIPLYVGGHNHGWKPVDHLDQLVDEAARHVANGFRAIKIRGGRKLPQPGDVESVRALREAFGDDLTIMIDANAEYGGVKSALRMCHALAEYGVAWIEDPCAFSVAVNRSDLGELTKRSPIPIASGGNIGSRFALRELIAFGGVDVVTANTAKSGGISEVRHLQSIASAWNLKYTSHAASGLNALSNLHVFAAAPPNLTTNMFLEWDPSWPLADLLVDPPQVDDGWVQVPDTPGLGSELRPDILERFALRDDSWFKTEMIQERVSQ
jgi:D-galactarolactone cycloisomerase